jgi:cytoskeletal protein RodZ
VFSGLAQGGGPEFRGFVALPDALRNTVPRVPAHLRPPERRAARPLGVLAIALGLGLLVIAGFRGRPADEDTMRLVRPATESSTGPTVLSEGIDQTTVPDAPPASAAGFTTTTTTGSGDQPRGATRFDPPPPTVAPPVSVTRPPPPRPTTTTTRPTSTTTAPSTTTTEEPTTTTEDTTTTTEP